MDSVSDFTALTKDEEDFEICSEAPSFEEITMPSSSTQLSLLPFEITVVERVPDEIDTSVSDEDGDFSEYSSIVTGCSSSYVLELPKMQSAIRYDLGMWSSSSPLC